MLTIGSYTVRQCQTSLGCGEGTDGKDMEIVVKQGYF